MENLIKVDKIKQEKGLALPTVIGYGAGGMGEAIAYNIFYMFFIYFLTNIAGINPAVAGTISLVAVMWDGITDPLVGHFSDSFKGNKYGKRVPFILFSCIPLGVTVFLLFADVSLNATAKVVYFTVINILFWLFFTLTDIPYISLASELTQDYDTRTKLRTSTTMFSNVGAMIVASGILVFVDYIISRNQTEIYAWKIVGLSMGALTLIAFLISALSLRGKEPKVERVTVKKEEKVNAVKEYLSLLKIKQYRLVVYIAFAMNLMMGISASSMVYFYMYSCGFDNNQISMVMFWPMIVFVLCAIPVGNIATKFGKKKGMLLGSILILASLIIKWFLPLTFTNMVISNIIYMIGNTAFWILIYAMNYDIVEIDEFNTGKRKDGRLVSLNSFLMKAGVAIGMWMTGFTLSLAKFDPEAVEQSVGFAGKMRFIAAGIPTILGVTMIIACLLYKVDKNRFNALKEALELKKQGKEYSTELFEDIL